MVVPVETLNTVDVNVILKGRKYKLFARVLYINDALKHRKPKIFVFENAGLEEDFGGR